MVASHYFAIEIRFRRGQRQTLRRQPLSYCRAYASLPHFTLTPLRRRFSRQPPPRCAPPFLSAFAFRIITPLLIPAEALILPRRFLFFLSLIAPR
jgi:hypothetical protein